MTLGQLLADFIFTNDIWVRRQLAPGHVQYFDHIGGFDQHYTNAVLDAQSPGTTVYLEYILPPQVKQQYTDINFVFDAELMIANNHLARIVPNTIPQQSTDRTKFLCCFNGKYHISRQRLLSELIRRNWFDPATCTKGFKLASNNVDPAAYQNQILLKDYSSLDIVNNLAVLSPIIQQCFVQLVSETVGQSYVPFVTEKSLFPCLNQTLWVAYAQPGYQQWVEDHMGLKRFSVFDYEFDSIKNHNKRLRVLLKMLSKFEHITPDQWRDIYTQEQVVIKHNFDHVNSLEFLNTLRKFDQRGDKFKT